MTRLTTWSQTLPVPVANPQRILVVGDTGCRIKGASLQACNDPMQWPFLAVSQAAAGLKPDLIIHVGDYLYRESPCPAGNAGCAGSPWGDNWVTARPPARLRLEEHLRAGTLVEVFPKWAPPPAPVSVMYPQQRHLTSRVRVLIDWLVELLAPIATTRS